MSKIKETLYLGRIPIFRRPVRSGTSFNFVERASATVLLQGENLSDFGYVEQRRIVTVKDQGTLNVLATPPVFKGYDEYADILGASEPNPEEAKMYSIVGEAINKMPSLPTRVPGIRRRLSYKA